MASTNITYTAGTWEQTAGRLTTTSGSLNIGVMLVLLVLHLNSLAQEVPKLQIILMFMAHCPRKHNGFGSCRYRTNKFDQTNNLNSLPSPVAQWLFMESLTTAALCANNNQWCEYHH